MMSKFLCGVLFMCCLNAYAAIGHVSGSFTDVDRNNRVVTYEAFYPSAVDGDNVAISDGQFPFVVFGHGFLMGYATYQNIWEFIVPNGYVMVFVTTEGGFPDHAAYGQDLVFIAQRFLELNTTSGELFENHLTNLYAFTGHSMGGGASWLAAANNSSVACLVGLAPAETNPSAIGAAANVTAPLLVLSGSDDTVTPPAENHIPMYEDASSDCKVFVNLVQGSHCGYADSGSLCDIGELGFNGMDRTIQQNITHDLLLMWYNRYLKNEGDVLALLSSYDTSNSNLDMQVSCAVEVEEVS